MRPARVFVSYSHKDEDHRVKIEKHLAMATRLKEATLWHDRKILAGDEFDNKISEHLEAADLILFLVSADFLHSRYCYEVEMKRALERHEAREAVVIPIFVSTVDWKGAPFEKLLGLPQDARPVDQWDNGDAAYTNIAKGIRERLAAHRDRTPRAGRKGIWSVPHAKNLNFEGRDEHLDGLRNAFATTPYQVLRGLPGVGKTQIAVEYAYRNRDAYDVVWLVRAESPESLVTDLAALAVRLSLGTPQDAPSAVAALRGWLSETSGWLLIFDNAPDLASLRPHLPLAPQGHVLITSRDPSWGQFATPRRIDGFTPEEARRFLSKRAGRADDAGAAAVASALHHFPLALEHAAAYVESLGISYQEYLDRFKRQRTALLDKRAETIYKETVRVTWSLALREAERRAPQAVPLLQLLSFLDADDVPRAWLGDALGSVEGWKDAFSSPDSYDTAIQGLRALSLIETAPDSLATHRLLQEVVRESLAPEDQRARAEAVLRLVDETFPFHLDDIASWGPSQRLIPHAMAILQHASSHRVQAHIRLMNKVGLYLHTAARLTEAKRILLDGLAAAEAATHTDPGVVSILVNNLGSVLKALGDLAGAKAHYERALKIDENAYGPDHPTVAIDVNNLGSVLKALGDLASAKAHYERALKIDENAYGPNHPTVAIRVNNLGSVLESLGDLAGAKAHYERALRIFTQRLGPDHPHTVLVRNNLRSLSEEAPKD